MAPGHATANFWTTLASENWISLIVPGQTAINIACPRGDGSPTSPLRPRPEEKGTEEGLLLLLYNLWLRLLRSCRKRSAREPILETFSPRSRYSCDMMGWVVVAILGETAQTHRHECLIESMFQFSEEIIWCGLEGGRVEWGIFGKLLALFYSVRDGQLWPIC